jgi:hypothetical protein
MKRHDGFMNAQDSFEQLETIVKPEIIQDIYMDRLKSSPLVSAAKPFSEENELSAGYLNALEDSIRQDEYGNDTVRVSAHYEKRTKNGNLTEITTGMKEIYRALRCRDSNIDESFDVKVCLLLLLDPYPDLHYLGHSGHSDSRESK